MPTKPWVACPRRCCASTPWTLPELFKGRYYTLPILPSSTRSSISSLHFSSFFDRGGGRDVITSYHHCRVRRLLPAIFILLISNFSMEGNSVAASSSSLKIAWFISLISSRNVSMEVREVRVSSVLEFSLHCSNFSSILLTVLYMVSFTFRSPKGVPYVFQVSSRLSHAFMVSSTYRGKRPPRPLPGLVEG